MCRDVKSILSFLCILASLSESHLAFNICPFSCVIYAKKAVRFVKTHRLSFILLNQPENFPFFGSSAVIAV